MERHQKTLFACIWIYFHQKSWQNISPQIFLLLYSWSDLFLLEKVCLQILWSFPQKDPDWKSEWFSRFIDFTNSNCLWYFYQSIIFFSFLKRQMYRDIMYRNFQMWHLTQEGKAEHMWQMWVFPVLRFFSDKKYLKS